MQSRQAIVVSLAASLLAGCASDFHGSYLVGERYHRTDIHTYPVIILSVDGRDTAMRRVMVDPGVREVRVQAPPVPGARDETVTFKLDVKPCSTYYIVAVRETRLSSDFQPKVDYVEPVGGCSPPAAK